MIDKEFRGNYEQYSEFLVNKDINKELRKYVEEKSYSREIGDIIIKILINASSTGVTIYRRDIVGGFV